ncbi:hypothetical protein FA13DRAFT_1816237 [Coprinellus micaceus]|uniref:NACHT domain-containing protein n=1 Tax=Coprinellus micaceus TaxID=71717 RepID=A0A4Y7T0Y1_COPMI|nr:hypothetical protein FA13DRAFT_1816237 [Coprinellus micaceus]
MDARDQLPNSQSVVVKSAQVRNVAGGYHDHSHTTTNVKNIQIANSGRHEMEALLKHVAHGALHDSAERGPDAPKCHPETRIAVQMDIMGWIEHGERDDAPRRILWLSGPAGSGKTAIAGTIADECHKKGLLAASFFFSAFAGSTNRRVSRLLISTLAYSLIRHKSIVGLKEAVLSAIEDDPIIFERHLDQQLETLILTPFYNTLGRSDSRQWPGVILIDGLDECQSRTESDIGPGGYTRTAGTNAQKEVLSVLSRVCADPRFPFRVIIASRPEPVIRQFFSVSPNNVLNIFLDDKYDPDSDIRLFLTAMFSDIRRRYDLPSTWASKDVVEILVKEASGQFIYAATVIRFLGNPRLGPPQQLLTQVLDWRSLNDSKPFAPLDLLYDHILRTSPDPLLAVKWIRFIHNHHSHSRDAPYLKCVLESYTGETEHVLGTLTSLIELVDKNRKPSFHFYHKSLLDFLGDPARCSDLHVNVTSVGRFRGERYYHTLQGRGHQSDSYISTNPLRHDFPREFCMNLAYYIDPRCRYTSEDVEWWLTNAAPHDRNIRIPRMYASIHDQCKWYHCLPACGVWRKGILQYCREYGWRVPTMKQLLRDRFKKIDFDPSTPEQFPLQRPGVESAESISDHPMTDA